MKIEPRLGTALDNTAAELGVAVALPPGVVRPELMFPSWPAPRWVRALCTTRRGGVGDPPFDRQNLAAHVGDDAGAVRDNRAALKLALKLERDPAWLEQMREAVLYRYEFAPDGFVPWADADGQWVSDRAVVPTRVTPVGDLLAAHVQAEIELRIVPSLWPLRDVAATSEFEFSLVRMHNARPRSEP